MNITSTKITSTKNSTTLLLLLTVVALSSNALADSNKHKKERHYRDHFAEKQMTAYGKVIDVRPIYREIRVSTPRKECWDEPVTVSRPQRGNSAAGTLAGAVIGGAIGHQLGKGRGNKLSTALGTVIGAQMGHDANRGGYSSTDRYTRYHEVCDVTENVNYKEVIEGYRVTYRYKGEKFRTRMPYDPGDRIKLRISVEPVY